MHANLQIAILVDWLWSKRCCFDGKNGFLRNQRHEKLPQSIPHDATPPDMAAT